ncbi:MAG: hypothetical protein QXE05_01525 [Nitrososphaeria archaeon]
MINKYLYPSGLNIYFDDNSNTRVIYYLKALFKNKNIYFNLVDHPKDADIIITDDENKYKKDILNVNEITFEPNLDFKKIVQKLFKKETIFLGVDPGERTGVALYYGKKLILNEVISPWENAIYFIVGILKEFEDNRKIVKIGCGNLKSADELKKILQARFDKIEIYFIDEKKTTKNVKLKGKQGKEKDKISALKILQREGRKVI